MSVASFRFILQAHTGFFPRRSPTTARVFLFQEVSGGVLLHHHREEQPRHATSGPQLVGGGLRGHQHQPPGQLFPLRPLPAQKVPWLISVRTSLFSSNIMCLVAPQPTPLPTSTRDRLTSLDPTVKRVTRDNDGEQKRKFF